jgi:hypothetical protein
MQQGNKLSPFSTALFVNCLAREAIRDPGITKNAPILKIRSRALVADSTYIGNQAHASFCSSCEHLYIESAGNSLSSI